MVFFLRCLFLLSACAGSAANDVIVETDGIVSTPDDADFGPPLCTTTLLPKALARLEQRRRSVSSSPAIIKKDEYDLCISALQHYPFCSDAFLCLGFLIITDGVPPPPARRRGRLNVPLGSAGASESASETRASATREIFKLMHAGSNIGSDGNELSVRELFLASIRYNSRQALAYWGLGMLMLTEGDSFRAQSGLAYLDLAGELGSVKRAVDGRLGAIAVLPDGRSMTSRELFLEAMRLDVNLSAAYYGLALTLAPHERIALPDGRHGASSQDLNSLVLRLGAPPAPLFAGAHDRWHNAMYGAALLQVLWGIRGEDEVVSTTLSSSVFPWQLVEVCWDEADAERVVREACLLSLEFCTPNGAKKMKSRFEEFERKRDDHIWYRKFANSLIAIFFTIVAIVAVPLFFFRGILCRRQLPHAA